MVVDNETRAFFLKESKILLTELDALGESLKQVRIPDEEESKRLSDFAQKLNRLIGGTAAVGFDMFTPLSRKTSLLAEKCAAISDITIKILVLNLNMVVSVVAGGFDNLESIALVDKQLPELEKRIDICLSSVGVDALDIKNQDQVDEMLKQHKLV